jgi:signal transduction histidine kinase/ligand-binding sensor domain-containing protein/DNA-binding response OmpR family regulator
MNKHFIILFFIAHTFSSVFGQRLQFNSLSVKDGLSQHDVSQVIQDSEGFIWIATYDGLNRYDGYRIENFFHDNNNTASLSSNRIRTLFEDQKKRIWIGTDGYGLNYYSLEDGKIARIKAPNKYDIINDITQNSKGEILVASSQGLFKVIENKNSFSVEVIQTPLTGLAVKNIKILNNGDIIYTTDIGIWLFKNNKYELIKGSNHISFNTILETINGEIWIGGRNGLYQISNQSLISKTAVVNSNILAIEEGIYNDLWLTTFQDGIIHVSIHDMKVSKVEAVNEPNQYSLANNPLQTIFKDKSNTLWIANKRGLLYTNLDSKNFKSLPIDKIGHVRTLFANNSKVYYGLQAGKFYVYTFNTNSTEVIKIPESAKAFKVDTLNGKVHLATTEGLFREKNSEKNEFEFIPIFKKTEKDSSLFVTSFCKDNFDNEYYGTFKGLLLKNKNESTWIHEKLKNLEYLRNVRVFSLKFDPLHHCIWVGTISNGLFKINLDKLGKIISVESYNEQIKGSYHIPNNSIWSFYLDKNTLYVGTDTGLLVKKPNKNEFESIMIEDIQNKKIMGIVADEFSNLWLNNSQGIIKYSTKTGATNKFNYYDGLLTNAFTEAISKNNNGELFFGSISGINYFKTSELKINPFPSKISFTELFVNNKKIEVQQELLGSVLLEKRLNTTTNLDFNYKQNDFSIEFTSTNYANVKVNKYRYKLVNYDKDWQEVNNTKRYASYSNIPSGNYTLFVEATNPNGQWSNEVREISISVQPATWNTWWAYLLYFLITSTILFTLIHFWSNKQKLRNQIKLSAFKSEQEKEINEMKLIFFTDVAHEFKTPLSLIIGPLNDLIKGNISKEHKDFCFNIVSRNTNRLMNLVNQLLDFRKINSGVNILKVSRNDMCLFVEEISKSFEWQAKTRNINLNFISPESYFCHFDKDIVEKVIYNLLSNAFKYTPNNGTIEIEIKPTWKQELEYFVILIKDSGKGISQQDKKKIFQRHFHGKDRSSSGIGLHLASSLIEAHRGEINVLNSALGGTEFMITLPVSSKAFTEEEYLSKEDIPYNLPKDYVPGDIIVEPENDDDDEGKEKILIVEDDYDLRKYLKNILKNDYNVFEANNGIEGLEKTLKEIPDIIISDVMMPELDGIEMCKKIKKNILTSHIPVLMLTAKSGEDFSNEGLKVGAWDYISKPFNSAQLLQKVKNIIKTRNSFRQYIAEGSSDKTENHYVSYDQKFVANLVEIIKTKMSEPNFSVQELSQELGLSRMQLHRKLKSLIGLNTTTFINSIKIEKAVQMLDDGCDRVQEAMDAVGINSYAHFISLFKKEKGVTPTKYIEHLKESNKIIN